MLKVLSLLAADWHNIGIFLDVPEEKLVTIKKDDSQSDDCLRDMLVTWLNLDPEPSWDKVAEAVEVKYPNKAAKIRSQYVYN